ncbi:MAG: hypothetical protein HRU06_19765 [Oceanospirillaceae bacterium]|nr:hypothetical protein [Oceanospirillaceae bacterium]
MSIQQELAAFYKRVGFGENIGKRSLTVPVYTGCLLVPLPNIETRHKYLKYHDLHHIMTGYSVGRIGEGEVSAWELGTGSFLNNPLLGIMNLIALSTGLVLEPARMWQAYLRGCISNNLYRAKTRTAVDENQWQSITQLTGEFVEASGAEYSKPLRAIEFGLYAAVAVMIHAAIAIPALILRVATDLVLKKNFIQAIKPVKRSDLY